jgi:hypothetical protein
MMLDAMQVQRMVTDFIKASTPLEAYLQQGGPLSSLQLDSVAATVSGLQTFLDIWKRKNITK